MSNNSYILYKKLYNSIKNEMKMPQSGNHQIDINNARLFIKNQCNDRAKKFANFVINNTIYITFNDFYHQIQKMADELIIYIKKFADNVKLILCLNDLKIYKSNFWVSCLLREILLKNGYDFYDVISGINSDIHNNLANGDKYIYIITDDCSYSGGQLSSDLFITPNKYKYLEDFFDNFKVFVFVPYMTNIAKKYAFINNLHYSISDINKYTKYLYFPKNIKYIPSFFEMCNDKKYNIFSDDVLYIKNKKVKSMVLDYFKIYTHTSLIYFDHKLADAVSIIQCVYNFGYVFDNIKAIYPENYNILINLNEPFFETNIINKFKSLHNHVNDNLNILNIPNSDKNYNYFDELINYFNYYKNSIDEITRNIDFELINNSNFNTECYNINNIKNIVQNFPLITCDNMNRTGNCEVDLNKDLQLNYDNNVCPHTYYKYLNFSIDNESLIDLYFNNTEKNKNPTYYKLKSYFSLNMLNNILLNKQNTQLEKSGGKKYFLSK